jgi:predicted negative regulator of RcsB-dependent stress response
MIAGLSDHDSVWMGEDAMAYKIKVTSKAVTDAQVAVHWLDRWAAWEEGHRRLLWPLVVGVFLVGLAAGGGWGWWWWQNHQAAVLAGEAAEHYPSPTDAAGPTPEDHKKPSVAAQCSKALPLYQQITDRYGRSRFAPLALYYQANCQVELGKADDAIALYKRIISEYGPTHETAQLASLRLGYLYADRGDRAAAIEQFQGLSQQTTGLNRDQALFEVGRVKEADNNREAALTAYRTVQKDFPKSPWSSEAAARIKALGGDAAAQPAAPATPAPAAAAPTPSAASTPHPTPAAPSGAGK